MTDEELLQMSVDAARANWRQLRRKAVTSLLSEEALTDVLMGKARLLLPEGAQVIHVRESFELKGMMLLWVHKDNPTLAEGEATPFKPVEVEHWPKRHS